MAPILAAVPPPPTIVPPAAVQAVVSASDWGSYVVKSGDSLHTIAQRHNTTVAALVQRNGLANGGRLIHPGQRLQVPGVPAAATAAKAEAATSTTTYTIAAGDTLIGIAQRHGTTARALAALNRINVGATIYVGRTLKVPTNGTTAAKAAASTAPAAPTPAPAAPAATTTYTVVNADTLIGIAQRHGTTARALAAINKINVGATIYVGQKLKVPANGAAAAKAASSSGSSSSPQQPTTPFNAGGYSERHFPSTTVAAAKKNHELLATLPVPTREQARAMIEETARRHGVDPALAVAIAYQESGWNHRNVSVANAIGIMQVIPASGDWAGQMLGREVNLLDPQDNVTAGVVILRAHLRGAADEDTAIAAYYQGMASVRKNGMYNDTKAYISSVKALRAKFS